MPEHHQNCRCPLCHSETEFFWFDSQKEIKYNRCNFCFSIFKNNSSFLNPNLEKKRYELHENDVQDKAYQYFVSPITTAVTKDFGLESLGLDYGCGSGPVISFILEQAGYKFKLYDPFFYPDKDYLNFKYDFITCCEVMEHFFKPNEEFKKLRSLLKDHGKLYCKTNFISNSISVEEFSQWYYKDDPTHVFFYTPKSFQYIKETFGYKHLDISEKLITFSL